MRILAYILTAAALFSQANTPLKVGQNSGSLTGQVWLQERRTNGTNWLKLEAPQALAADYSLILPIGLGSTGDCLTDSGSGQLAFSTCGTSTRRRISDYFWSQTPGGSISVGLNTVTLTPCPTGLDASDTLLPVYISGGPGAAEAVYLSTSGGAGTCTSGAASGTIKFTAANTHTGAWTIKNAGFREAERASSAGDILLISNLDAYGTTTIQKAITLEGGGGGGIGSTITTHGDIIAIDIDLYEPVIMKHFAIVAAAPQVAAGAGIRIGYAGSSNHNCASVIDDVTIVYHYDGIHLKDGCKPTIFRSNIGGSTRHNVLMQNLFCADCGDQFLSNNTFGAAGAESISYTSGGGAKIIGNKFLGGTCGLDVPLTGASSILIVQGNSFDQQTQCGVRVNPTATLHSINISGNTITPSSPSGYFYGIDYGNTGSLTLTNAVIAKNTIHCPTTADSTAIRIRTSELTALSDNPISYCAIGVQIDAGATKVGWGKNTILGTPTPFSIHASADLRPYSPIMASGYLRPMSSGSNIQAIAEFAEPASGGANNGILLSNTGTGTTSQRGLVWDNGSNNLKFSRLDSARSAAETVDFEIETGGNARAYNKLGVGISPGFQMDIGGGSGTNYLRISDSTAGTSLFAYAENGATNIGSLTNHSLRILTDNNVRWQFSAAGMLVPWANDTYDIADSSTRVRGVYAKFGEFYKSGSTASSDYVKTRKYNIMDQTGSSGSWDWQAVVTATSSETFWRDNAGDPALELWRQEASSPVNYSNIYTDWMPSKRDTGLGHSVSDTRYPRLGATGRRWDAIFVDDGIFTDDVTVGDTFGVTGFSTFTALATFNGNVDMLASGINYMYGTLAPQTNGTGSIGTSSARYGDFYGVDAQLSGRLQVTGSTTLPVRGGVEFSYDSTGNGGAGWGGMEVYGPGTTTPKAMTWVAEDHRFYFGAVTTLGWTINSSGHFVPGTNNTRDVGASGTRVKKIWAVDVDFSGTCTGCSGGGSTFADNVFRVQDDGDTSKQLAFQLSGFTTGNTRTLTPQNGSYTIAGLDITQTFTAPQTFSSSTVTISSTLSSDVIPTTGSVYALGGSSTRWIGYFNTMNSNGQFTFGGNLIPASNSTYSIGSTTVYPLNVYANYLEPKTALVMTGTVTGDLDPTLNNTYQLGDSAFKWAALYVTNSFFYGTIQAPNGNTGLSTTKTVRASGGASDCTLIYSGGLLTGGTC